MRWTYHITAASKPRVLMRLVQVFDQQSMTISSLELALLNDSVSITLTVDADRELADRVRAKLYNQIDIRDVDLYAL
jgi:acetolactate synthase regulatory subunit